MTQENPTKKSHARLNEQRLNFIKFYGETNGNGTKSARLAGYRGSDGILATTASRLLRNAKVLEKLEAAHEAVGLTDNRLLEKHLELLEANKIQSAVVYITQDGEQQESKNDFIEVPDKRVQLGALSLAYELKGRIRRKIEHMGKVGTKEVIIILATSKEIEDYKKKQVPGGGNGNQSELPLPT